MQCADNKQTDKAAVTGVAYCGESEHELSRITACLLNSPPVLHEQNV